MKEHLYKYKKITLGATPSAVDYAYKNKIPIFFIKRKEPLPLLSFVFESESLNKYREKLYLLSLSGNVPLYNNIESMRIEDNNLTVATKDSRVLNIEFEEAAIFDEDGLSGLGIPETADQPLYVVLDWFNVRSGMCHKHQQIESGANFVKYIQFYPSERIDGNHDKKDLVAVSVLAEEQLHDIEYSEIYAKFKVLHHMREAGIYGARNGLAPSGSPKYHQLKIESDSRDIRKITRPVYKNTEHLKFKHAISEWNKVNKT